MNSNSGEWDRWRGEMNTKVRYLEEDKVDAKEVVKELWKGLDRLVTEQYDIRRAALTAFVWAKWCWAVLALTVALELLHLVWHLAPTR